MSLLIILFLASAAVRALLRHGASVSARSTTPTLAISPSLQPPGSTALHFAAAAEDVSLVLVLLEAQVSKCGCERPPALLMGPGFLRTSVVQQQQVVCACMHMSSFRLC
jgi:ankyrin repeat protein